MVFGPGCVKLWLAVLKLLVIHELGQWETFQVECSSWFPQIRHITQKILHITPLFYTDLEKSFSTVMLKWVLGPSAGPSNWNMIQKSGTVRHTLGHDQEAFRCRKTVRQGRDSKTHSRMNSSYTLEVKELIPWWCKEWLICWWPHVGIFQPPLKTPGGFFFVFIYNFFFK